MEPETNLSVLLKTMRPKLNEGEYVFCTVANTHGIDQTEIIGSFREEEGLTLILDKNTADELNLDYSYIAAWITLTVNSSLEAVGLTAAFATALGQHGISCNVMAAYYHDHIFVAKKDAANALKVLLDLSGTNT